MQGLWERLGKRLGDSKIVHDHPPRPWCWACGSDNKVNRAHEIDCPALLAVAKVGVNAEDETRRRYGGEVVISNRTYWGGILDRARAAGVNLKLIRPDADATVKWTREEPPSA